MLALLFSLCRGATQTTERRRRPIQPDEPHGSQAAAQEHSADPSFVHKVERWQTLKNGNEGAVCEACFPLSVAARDLCMPECIFPVSDINEVHAHIINGKEPAKAQPWFIIGYGPPASGKAGIIATLERLRTFGVTARSTVATEVDGLFQNELSVGRRFAAQQAELAALAQTPKERELAAGRLYSTYRFVADQVSDAVLWKAAARWERRGVRTPTARSFARCPAAGHAPRGLPPPLRRSRRACHARPRPGDTTSTTRRPGGASRGPTR